MRGRGGGGQCGNLCNSPGGPQRLQGGTDMRKSMETRRREKEITQVDITHGKEKGLTEKDSTLIERNLLREPHLGKG